MSESTAFTTLDESVYDEDTGNYTHHCGSMVMAATVYHSIHDGPFPLSGSGQVKTETVPYCPTCEKKPSPYGRPITC